MDFLYAELDENNICVGISQLADEVFYDHMIKISETEFVFSLIGKKYENGMWVTLPKATLEEPISEINLESIKNMLLEIEDKLNDIYVETKR